jgi:hypothetical protein
MAVVALGGPAANLVAGAAAWWVSRWTWLASPVRAAFLAVAAVGVLRALINLLPVRRRMGSSSAGWEAVAWLSQPHRKTRLLRERAPIMREYRAFEAGEPVDQGVVAPFLTSSDAVLAAMAGLLTVATADPGQRAAVLADRARLRALALGPGVPRPLAGQLLMGLTWAVIDQILDAGGQPPDPDLVDAGVELAEAGLRVEPRGRLSGTHLPQHRTNLALLLLWQGQPLSAQKLLRGDALVTEFHRADTLAVRALVEAELGNLAEARRYAALANAVDSRADWVASLSAKVAATIAAREQAING